MRQSVLLYVLLFACCVRAESIRLTNGEWSPYLGQNLPYYGVASRIIEEAFALEGVQVQWDFYPWARALLTAERGQAAGSAVWLRNAERAQAFLISEPVIDSSYYLFHRKDHPIDWQRLQDLRGQRLAGVIDYDYGQALQRAEHDGSLSLLRIGSEEQGLRMLLAGRIDAFPIDKVVAMDLLYNRFEKSQRSQLTFSPRPLSSDTLHLLLSRRLSTNQTLLERFNRGLERLRKTGKVSRYLLDIERPLSRTP
ncbi:substrate-binding periplasmic protein [Pseudomonas sp. LRF_L74]|uniref:substrate-binding periplasmic protein n=1 Tax=Pseudomonas sp. LRF_L74 TaxID=3369422 RepID=UPI003F61A452